jgi:very-short-patch-repair endonuclease
MGEDAERSEAGGGSLEARARYMRKNPTDAERQLWYALKDNRFAGYKFRRQEPIGQYIADFVCYRPRIVVEVDGSQHSKSDYDLPRDHWFKSQGFVVLRFWNVDVLTGLEGVLTAIGEAIKMHPQRARPSNRGKSERTFNLGDEP